MRQFEQFGRMKLEASEHLQPEALSGAVAALPRCKSQNSLKDYCGSRGEVLRRA